MGLGRVYCGCIISGNAVMNVRTFIAPLPIWSYVGLGLGRKGIMAVDFVHSIVVMNTSMLIAPLPMWSYVGLGSRNVVMDMY